MLCLRISLMMRYLRLRFIVSKNSLDDEDFAA